VWTRISPAFGGRCFQNGNKWFAFAGNLSVRLTSCVLGNFALGVVVFEASVLDRARNLAFAFVAND
jgi:hypothetical protein